MDAAPCLLLPFPGARRSWRSHRVRGIPHEPRAVAGALARPLAEKLLRCSSLPRPQHVPSQVAVKNGGAFAQVRCMTFPHAADCARRPEEAGARSRIQVRRRSPCAYQSPRESPAPGRGPARPRRRPTPWHRPVLTPGPWLPRPQPGVTGGHQLLAQCGEQRIRALQVF